MKKVSRSKKLLALTMSAIMLLSAGLPAAAAEDKTIEAVPYTIESSDITPGDWVDGFANPEKKYQGGFRYWLPLGYTEDQELERELEEIAAKGFTVIELTTQANPSGTIPEGQPYAGQTYLEAYGMGSDEWTRTIQTVLRKASELGLRVDYHVSMNNGSNKHIPGMTPNDEAASKTLVNQVAAVDGTTLPTLAQITPTPATYRDNVTGESGLPVEQHLYAALLVNITEKGRRETLIATNDQMGGGAGVTTFSANLDVINTANIIDVTPFYAQQSSAAASVDAQNAVNEALSSDVEGIWEVIGFWWRGDGVTVSSATQYPSFRPDYFNEAGAHALMDYYENHVFQFDNPKFADMRELVMNSGGNIFADSYGAVANWSNDLPEQFLENTGESLVNYLPAIFFPRSGSTLGYLLDDIETTEAAVNDYMQAMTDLHCMNLDVLVERCHAIGLEYRDQTTYATSRLDLIQAASHIDIAEGESLNQADSSQYFGAISSAAHFLGKEIVSTEHSAIQQGTGILEGQGKENYESGSMQLSLVTSLKQANRAFAGGVNQLIFHGYTYDYDEFEGHQISWPGRMAYRGGFTNDWKDSLPQWTQMDIFADYAARVGSVMRAGTVKRDVGIYKQSYFWPRHVGILWRDYALNDAGYTFDFINTSLLTEEQAVVEDGVLAPKTAGYRAFIFDATGEKDLQDVADDLITLTAIEKLAQFAEEGLPLVFVGSYPTGLQGINAGANQTRFEAALSRIQAVDNQVLVATRADVPNALKELGVTPSAENLEPDRITSYHTQADGVDYYWLYNQSKNYINGWSSVNQYVTNHGGKYEDGYAITTKVALEGTGVPFLMNPYSGEVTAIADYEIDEEGRIVVEVSLEIDDTTIIAIGSTSSGTTPVYGTIDGIAQLVYDNGELAVKAEMPGIYATELSDGASKMILVDSVAKYSLSPWELEIDSYTQKSESATAGKAVTEMKHTIYSGITLTQLMSWKDLGVQTVLVDGEEEQEVDLAKLSGIGTYTAILTAPGNLSDKDGLYLNVNDSADVFRVYVNGVELPNTSPLGGRVDLRGYLEAGENTIEIVTPTGLGNAMRGTTGYNLAAGNYGLRENATLTPYSVVSLDQAVDNVLNLSTDAFLVEAGDYANITTEFAEMVNSNTAIINYTFDTELFQYADFHPESGVTVISKEATGAGAKVVVMIPSYNTLTYGRLAIQAKPDAELSAGWASVKAEAEYVVMDDNGEKTINDAVGVVCFTTFGPYDPDDENKKPRIKGDTNLDGVIDLIDLSNMIDWFGIDNSDSKWDSWYVYFDFNNNGDIDIYDIVFVAQRIE